MAMGRIALGSSTVRYFGEDREKKKFVSFNGNFKLSKFFSRAQSRRLFCCKLEGINFQERTSPDDMHEDTQVARFQALRLLFYLEDCKPGAGLGLMDVVSTGFIATGSDRTAVVALPSGIGTLDETFEILALIQLERIGSMLPVPFLLMKYDSFYSKLLDFLNDCDVSGTLSKARGKGWETCLPSPKTVRYLLEICFEESDDA
ncbi:Hypothetical predicted protein, partial [Olea europaea subsp. europaea]